MALKIAIFGPFGVMYFLFVLFEKTSADLKQMNEQIPGWWYTYTSEKYEFVNWDDDIPNIWKKNQVMFQSPPTRYTCN